MQKKIKNSLVVSLMRSGISTTTEHTVPVKDAYKAFAFRDAIVKANEDIDKKREGLVKSAGIEDGRKFDERMKELSAIEKPTKEQKKELEEAEAKLKKFNELYVELMNDERELEGVKTMPYESFHALAAENKATRIPATEHTIDIFSVFAGELQGILWVAPVEE